MGRDCEKEWIIGVGSKQMRLILVWGMGMVVLSLKDWFYGQSAIFVVHGSRILRISSLFVVVDLSSLIYQLRIASHRDLRHTFSKVNIRPSLRFLALTLETVTLSRFKAPPTIRISLCP